MIPASANPLLLRSAATQYQVSRSLRYNAPDSSFLSRTPASAGNRKTWTFSCWTKRSILNQNQIIFSAGPRSSSGNATGLVSLLWEGDILVLLLWTSNASNVQLKTTQVFRDPSAWYHIVAVLDTDNATSTDRSRLYVNGSRITTFSSASYPSLGAQFSVNNTEIHEIGRYVWSQDQYLSSYLAEIHFIDGQALTPSSFTEVSATTGQLVPKAYTGTYGTNGFKLTFSDNSATTATTLGKDSAGSNNWTPNNFSVTAGAGNDSLVDTPTSYGTDTGAGGEVRGNYATWNPLWNKDGATLSNGNLDYTTTTSTAQRPVYGSIPVSSGKWYWEITRQCTKGMFVGIMSTADNYITAIGPGYTANSYAYYAAGTKWNNSAGVAYGAGYANGDVIGVALDLDNGRIFFSKNGTWQASGNPATGANPAFSSLSGTFVAALSEDGQSGSSTGMVANFGQRQWAYAAPAGFKALCDTNLPAPVVAKPNTVMDVALWTGNGSARSITGLGFSPDLVWIKGRSGATDHAYYDVVRGTEKRLEFNNTDTEVTSDGGVTAFNSDGFSLGTLAQVNTNAATYVGWAWDAGSSTVTNTDGSITSQVRANASAGFSIVTYVGNGVSGSSIGHGLNATPKVVIIKNRDAVGGNVYFTTTVDGSYDFLVLNNTDAKADSLVSTFSSSVFFVGSGAAGNGSGNNLVAYCFAPVAGYSSFGSYTGNGSTDGPFVYTGFRPRWIMLKWTSGAGGDWFVLDTARDTYNFAQNVLIPNSSAQEQTGANGNTLLILSNGFKLNNVTSNAWNGSSQSYIYCAFAESPLQYARAR